MKEHIRNINVVQAVSVGLCVLLLAAGSWWGYSAYWKSVNTRAQYAFALALDNFEKVQAEKQKGEVTETMWKEVENDFEAGYAANSSSSLAPFFLTYQSEVVLQQGDREKAIEILEKATNLMRSASPLYYIYAGKLALLRYDSDKPEIAEQGKKELLALANDDKNPEAGYAWYQLWHHAWIFGDKELASMAYARLASYTADGAQWGLVAQAKIESIL